MLAVAAEAAVAAARPGRVNAALNPTHDPALRSWVDSANQPGTDFPLQNLPFAVFRRARSAEPFRGGIAIGDQILDLAALHSRGWFSGAAATALAACAEPPLNRLMALGSQAVSALRAAVSLALEAGAPGAARLHACLVPQAEAQYDLPARIGDYTDFYASIYHATAVGRLFRPTNPLLPNYKWMPIAYHGRASSIGITEQRFRRPVGQSLPSWDNGPTFGASRSLDYELEVGLFIGRANALGSAVPIERAEEHVFGLCLLNDWSARDLQSWEYQPLGPFLGKNFATTISPWVITLEALAPFRIPWSRPIDDPLILPYLDSATLRATGAIDLQLEAHLETARMRATGLAPQRLSYSNFRHSYWTVAQMVAHHCVNGCNLKPGDLFGSGTLSGPTPSEAGSLLELTAGGKRQIELSSGETRSFLCDWDRVILRAWCERPGHARIGFGESAGLVLPAREPY
jgi:fumarylacetoacetase